MKYKTNVVRKSIPDSKPLVSLLTMCAAVYPQTAPHPRKTLTLRALLDSRWIVLPLQGESKLTTFKTVCGEGAVEEMPVRSVLRQSKVPIEVWQVT